MPAGAQTFDRFGNVLLDLTDRVPRFLGVRYIAPNESGSITDDGFLTGEGFCIRLRTGAGSQNFMNNTMIPPTVTFSGNVMTYGGSPGAHRLIYGVY